MSAIVDGKIICDCKRCAALPVPKKLSRGRLRIHRRTYGISDPLPSNTSMAVHGGSNTLQEQSLLNLNHRNHTNDDPSAFVETPADQSRSFPDEEDLLQSDEQASPDEEDDQSEEEEFDESESESGIDESSEINESEEIDDDESLFSTEDIDHDLDDVAVLGDYQRRNGIDEDEDMEIRILMTFSGTSSLLHLY